MPVEELPNQVTQLAHLPIHRDVDRAVGRPFALDRAARAAHQPGQGQVGGRVQGHCKY